MASISLKNICKKYPNGFEAVKDFNTYTNNVALYDYTILNTGIGKDDI